MRKLQDKIHEEYKKSKELSELLLDCDNYNKAQEIMAEQTKHYNKFVFLKKLKKALENEKNGRNQKQN